LGERFFIYAARTSDSTLAVDCARIISASAVLYCIQVSAANYRNRINTGRFSQMADEAPVRTVNFFCSLPELTEKQNGRIASRAKNVRMTLRGHSRLSTTLYIVTGYVK